MYYFLEYYKEIAWRNYVYHIDLSLDEFSLQIHIVSSN